MQRSIASGAACPILRPLRTPSANPAQPAPGTTTVTAQHADRQRLLLLAPAYLVLLVAAEILTVLTRAQLPLLGAACYGAVLLLFLAHTLLCWDRPFRAIPLLLAAAPLARLSLLLSPEEQMSYGLLALGGPVLAAGLAILNILVDRRPDWAGLAKRIAAVLAGLAAPWWLSLRKRMAVMGVSVVAIPAMALLAALLGSLLIASAGTSLETIQLPGPVSGNGYAQGARARGSLVSLAAGRLATPAATPTPPASPTPTVPPTESPPGPTPIREGPYPQGVQPRPQDVALAWPPPTATAPPTESPHCPSSGYANTYPHGVCTWYAKARRPDLPGFSGQNGLALHWPRAAELCGFLVNQEPAVGAVLVFPPGANGASSGGHVAYVEEVSTDYILTSECNVSHSSGWAVAPLWWEGGYSCAFRRIPRAQLHPGVWYIHERIP